ncbi:hypothetical protein POM88_026603 [Heracleum sosnowskyi]|uniref:Uncharacterized protein n=1 Tax=Heracleum sosnowskyi TaxID=360622 RepID=A0AAD8I7G5_9APIA|nr:hypothetical protein POM88_026603 [Heracleum sosnowskyi]
MEAPPSITFYSDRQRQLEAFDDTKAGLKGLVDAGVEKIPDIFAHALMPLTRTQKRCFMGVHRFFEQDTVVKKQFYTRDYTKKVVYNTNYDFFSSPAANWRDSFFCFMAPSPPQPDELPEPHAEEVCHLVDSNCEEQGREL